MRNLIKTECDVLVKEKLKNGKPLETAIEEVKRDKEYIDSLNKKIKRDNLSILKLQEERSKLNDRFKKEFEKLRKSQDKMKRPITIPANTCSTNHLHRIIEYLKENKESKNLSEISRFCMINKDIVAKGLLFLIKHKLIQEIYFCGNKTYTSKEII